MHFTSTISNRFYGTAPRKDHQRLFPDVTHALEKLICTEEDVYKIEAQEDDEDVPIPVACSFSTLHPRIACIVDEDGGLLVINTGKPGVNVLKSWRAHNNSIFDIDWIDGENHLLTASADQTIKLWDIQVQKELIAFKGHTASVKTVTNFNKNEFATGSRDGSIMLWDARINPKDKFISPVNTIHNAHSVSSSSSAKKRRSKLYSQDIHQQSVTSVVYQDEYSVISAGDVDGTLKLWDLRKIYNQKNDPIPKFRFVYAGTSIRSHGYSNLVLDSTKSQLFANCMDNIIYRYNCSSNNSSPDASYRGHDNKTFYIKASVSHDNMFLLSGSSDGNAYIFKIDQPIRSPLVLKSHVGEVSAVAWCPTDVTKVLTVGDDSTVRVWHHKEQSNILRNVGYCQWLHKDKGVSVRPMGMRCSPRLNSPMKSPKIRSPVKSLRSPLKSPVQSPLHSPKYTQIHQSPLRSPQIGSVLPYSLVPRLSPACQKSIVALSNKNSSPKNSRKLKSACIKKFLFSPSTSKAMSPLKSPRKLNLILSPRKISAYDISILTSTKENIRIVDKAVNFCENLIIKTPSKCLKRKRTYSESAVEIPIAKRKEVEFNENCYSVPRAVFSPRTRGTEKRVLSPKDNQNSCNKKLMFDDSPVKSFITGTPTKFCSPTLNLPNYVLDLQRTPGSVTPNSTRVNQIRHSSCDHENINCKLKSPCSTQFCFSPKVKCQSTSDLHKTPTSNKKGHYLRSSPRQTPTRGRRSILHYFSPKSSSPADKIS